ncbi:flagellin, partial [uncultured Desulfovibrio sp.]|uniref:flagellin N-terminal helical domain-containing protein n=1 Tax=uncultured Desulfovibrio sp. TaxID=167968 RepID=UPI00261F5460
MSLVINNNMMAANTARNLNAHYGRLATSTQRLSTGLRVNSAADDAAGLAIRELQRADIAALHQGARNANDAISMIQTADGAMGVIDEKLVRLKELAEQAATGTYDSTQRLMIESEYQAMASEITRIANATDFNGIHLLDGTLSSDTHDGTGMTATGKMKIHFGSGNDSAEDYYYITIGNCTASALGVGNAADPEAAAYTVSTQAAAQKALEGINEAIVSKDKIRAHLGAMQNRLENTITNLNVQAENLQAAESRIS